MPIPIRHVPCGSCTLCCRNDLVRLLPEDDASLYRTEPHPFPVFHGARMLAHKPNGECVYLGPNGCTIHTAKPSQCRSMDCRIIAQRLTYTRARKMHHFNIQVWKRGKELLRNERRSAA